MELPKPVALERPPPGFAISTMPTWSSGGFAPATTDDFLRAIAEVRPSITASMAREFEEDIERFARF